mmetsp:Transcript_8465/g.22906  ORF Transcript_8465/g.22906 Transcript_8465/m.22906 type:complete len:141 (-) Transcript_8465:154-576(-)|eukprot:CAMPEP_0198116812 /NCGR_PEP_ID=MMETSP1442-20131203/14578_1 /TAXON_ID= /ORGANISM="Craspedostauros australis, Strain CCMP3328" /LENGTH=140 /DNA_ID=CAMNT_0043774721 /DNA_START=154 /DNA_END=576 /DNA_ORIENTATION=-
MTSPQTAASTVRQSYRMLAQLIRRLPNESHQRQGMQELRSKFRKPLQDGETIDLRLQEATDRASYLRIMTPKDRKTSSGGRWIYKDGKRLEASGGKVRDAKGKVISNWDGKNLDPDHVKQHNYQLKRAGFRNNAHAKGFF